MSHGQWFRAIVVAAGFVALLGGCVGTTALSQLDTARPIGDAFSQELFKNYAMLAHSFGVVGAPSSGTPFDAEQSIQVGSMSAGVADIANEYAAKALAVAQGDDILPEDADPAVAGSESMRMQLLRDLDQGREKVPERAARAQADYDCWIVNARSDELKRASRACRRSLGYSLAQLESGIAAATPPAAPAQDSAAAQSAAPSSAQPAPSNPPGS